MALTRCSFVKALTVGWYYENAGYHAGITLCWLSMLVRNLAVKTSLGRCQQGTAEALINAGRQHNHSRT